MAGDDIVKTEQTWIERLVALGLGRYEAIQAVDSGAAPATIAALSAERDPAPAELPFGLQAG